MNASQNIKSLCVSMRPVLLGIAYRRLGNLDDAEDAVGRALCIVLQKSRSEPDRPVPKAIGWIKGILTNVLRQDAAARGVYERMPTKIDQDGEPTDPLTAIIDDDRRDYMRAELVHEARYVLRFADLSIIERKCFVNRINGMRRKDNAKDTGLSQEGVHTALQRAVKRIRACPMKPDGCPTYASGEELFWFCAQVSVYRSPPKTGQSLSREKSSRANRSVGNIVR